MSYSKYPDSSSAQISTGEKSSSVAPLRSIAKRLQVVTPGTSITASINRCLYIMESNPCEDLNVSSAAETSVFICVSGTAGS